MIYRLRHATTYDYAEPVMLGTHFMHLLPRERPGQAIREAQLDISPMPESRRPVGHHTFGIRSARNHHAGHPGDCANIRCSPIPADLTADTAHVSCFR